MNIAHNATVLPATPSEKRKTTHRLNAWNLRDWFSIAFWIFFNPARIGIHHNLYGPHAMKRTAGWLIATLVTVTLLLLVSPLVVDAYLSRYFIEHYDISPLVLLVGALVIGLMLGIMSYIENELSLGLVYGIGFGLSFSMIGVVAFGVMQDASTGLALTAGASVALGIIFGISRVVVLRLAYVVAGIFAVGMTFSVAGIITFAICIFVSMTAGNILHHNVKLGRPTSAGFAVLLLWLTSILMMVGSVLTLIS